MSNVVISAFGAAVERGISDGREDPGREVDKEEEEKSDDTVNACAEADSDAEEELQHISSYNANEEPRDSQEKAHCDGLLSPDESVHS